MSGKRMIRQGTDGLSRGDFSSGVMAGERKVLEIFTTPPVCLRATTRSERKTGSGEDTEFGRDTARMVPKQ